MSNTKLKAECILANDNSLSRIACQIIDNKTIQSFVENYLKKLLTKPSNFEKLFLTERCVFKSMLDSC